MECESWKAGDEGYDDVISVLGFRTSKCDCGDSRVASVEASSHRTRGLDVALSYTAAYGDVSASLYPCLYLPNDCKRGREWNSKLTEFNRGMQTVWVMGNETEVLKLPKPEVEGYLTYGGDVYGNESHWPAVLHYQDAQGAGGWIENQKR